MRYKYKNGDISTMKTKHLIKTLGYGALVAGALAISTSANAATQLIHFDDANNGWKWYSDVDRNFLFDPTNLQSGNCADSTSGGNGSCVIENQQGVLPLMTRPEIGATDQGSSNQDPDASGANLSFDLDSFYFNLSGAGQQGDSNAITVTGSNTNSFTFQLGDIFSLGNDPMATFYDGLNAGDPAGALAHNTGYIATFGDMFDDVTWIQFSSASTAQVRLDCVVATFDGETSEPRSGFSGGCGGGTTQVPEPSILALLSIGFLGIGAARKLKKH